MNKNNLKSVAIFPSLISSDILNIRRTLDHLDKYVDGYHLDIMDDHFVPNLTWGPLFINEIAHATKKILFVHLMVEKPESWLSRLTLRDGDTLAFHIENKVDHISLINSIKEKKIKSSIAISPKTPLEKILGLANVIDQILLMSVEPGASGQSFIESSIGRLKSLVEFRRQHNLGFKIVMDGGINQENISQLTEIGVDQVACASSIFGSGDSVENIIKLREAIDIIF